MARSRLFFGHIPVSGGTVTGSGSLASQSSTAAGEAERVIPGSGTLASQSSALAGTAEREHTGSGTLLVAAASISGAGVLQVKILLTAAVSRELRDENGQLVSSLSNIAYEWYDGDTNTNGNPDQSGTFSTDANGEATIQLPNSGLVAGQVGLLILTHPSNPAIRGVYRIPVS